MIERQQRAAILAADIAGYSALMAADDAWTVRDLNGRRAASSLSNSVPLLPPIQRRNQFRTPSF
jgi:hypothetical protein